MTEHTLHARVAHAHLVAGRDVISMGGGASNAAALAGQPSPEPPGQAETPGPPKRVGSEFPSAVSPQIPKKPEKKNVPGVHRACWNCYYAISDHDRKELTCHARSPKPSSTTARVIWPAVTLNDWCGEWANLEAALNWPDEEPNEIPNEIPS